MSQQLTHPGVYVEEIPSGVRTIVGAATSITAFVGRTRKGSAEEVVLVTSYASFVEKYGGLWDSSRLGFAVRDFYLNGGKQALICRLFVPTAADDDGKARLVLGTGQTQISLVAASPGAWGNDLRAAVDQEGLPLDGELFNLALSEKGGRSERLKGLSLYNDQTRNILDVLAQESTLARWGKSRSDLLVPPAPGTPRVGPANGATDPASAAEATLSDKQKAAKNAVQDQAAAVAGKAQAETAKKAADDKVTAADAAEKAAKTKLDQANAAVTAAQALDQSVPENQQKLAAAMKQQEDTETAHTAAAKTLADANTAATKAATDLTAAGQAATDAKSKVDQAKKDADDAAKAVATEAGKFGADDGTEANSQTIQDLAGPMLKRTDLFNILCIPPYKSSGGDVEPAVFDWGAGLCTARRALLLVDPPTGWSSVDAAVTGFRADADQLGGRSSNAAVYFPRLRQPNPLRGNAVETFVPCGAVAGVMARTDAARGVWKAPAGLEATLTGVPDLAVKLDDDGNGQLNPLGINCLRSFPVVGRVVWGARTLVGADVLASDWKYIPVRRLALYIEESLFRGTQWVVFEPNDEPLWAQIRLSVGSFMHQLFRQGAFQGRSPKEAYFVKCDAETTTQADRNLGVVNIVVGFAPLKPAEFVVIRLQQMAGQIEV